MQRSPNGARLGILFKIGWEFRNRIQQLPGYTGYTQSFSRESQIMGVIQHIQAHPMFVDIT
jgi:hypothetical protein